MPTGYQIGDPRACYFLTLQVVDWVDVFSRKRYRDIVIESLKYCRQHKGLKLYGYVVMTNHVHFLCACPDGNLSSTLGDMKKFTSRLIRESIQNEPESRRDWMLALFARAARSQARSDQFQVWTHENHAIECFTTDFSHSKLDYIHLNPVRAGFVEKAEDWLYSSARNFTSLAALMDIDYM